MASPQTENGYTAIANELIEAIYTTRMSGMQKDIVLCIIRFTYGFSRKSHIMSASFISKAIGCHNRTVRQEIEKLIRSKVIIEYKQATYSRPREIGINKDFEQWELNDSEGVKRLPGSETTPRGGSEMTPERGSEMTPQENKSLKQKQNKRKNTPKNPYTENVFLTENQFESIAEKYGTKGRDRIIELLSTYKLSSGKKYKDDYAAMRNWVFARYEKESNWKPAENNGEQPQRVEIEEVIILVESE